MLVKGFALIQDTFRCLIQEKRTLEQQEKGLILKPEINYPTEETHVLSWPTQPYKPSQEANISFLGNVPSWNPKKALIETQGRAADHYTASNELSYHTGVGWENN